ncbi:MAG: ABC transporter permease [Chloroflexi bacterium]|nr:MAG: ABC transporter permease [Chloroflexota bacterium]
MATTGETLQATAEEVIRKHETKRTRLFYKDAFYKLLSLISPFVLLAIWEIVVRTEILNPIFFPPPTEIFKTMIEMVQEPDAGGFLLQDHIAISLRRVILGFLLGTIPGLILGLLIGWFRSVRAFFDPIIAATYPIPKISLLPLMLVIFGFGETSKIVTVAIAGFFLVLISTAAGVTQIDHVLIQAAENYGAKRSKLFTKVILPATLPSIFTGLRLSLGISLLIVVAAEFINTNSGIGFLIWSSWQVLAVKKMYAGLIVIAALGLFFTSGLERIGRFLMPWAGDIQSRTK